MAPATLPTVLVFAEDDALRTELIGSVGADVECLDAATPEEARKRLGENYVQVLVSPVLADSPAAALLDDLAERWPETERVEIGDPERRSDATHPPIQVLPVGSPPALLRSAVAAALRQFRLTRENERLAIELKCHDTTGSARIDARRTALSATTGFESVLRGPGSPIEPVVEAARQYASFDIPVLIRGESGTGKGDFARAMHAASLRSHQGFHALDCAGLPEDFLTLELLGARNGSVPAGNRTRIGLLQKADRGTVYLANIHALPFNLQGALARLLRDGSFLPLGGHEPVSTNIRLVCSTDQDLSAAMAAGSFRGDLYYAISVGALDIPPLRDRRSDVPLLARRICFDTAAAHAKPVHGLSDTALEFLTCYDWPGNLRELTNEVTRMLVFSQDKVLGPEVISRHILQADPCREIRAEGDAAVMTADGTLKDRIEAIEARILRETLTRLKWNKSRAAGELGLSRVGLRAKLDRYGVMPPETESEQELEEG